MWQLRRLLSSVGGAFARICARTPEMNGKNMGVGMKLSQTEVLVPWCQSYVSAHQSALLRSDPPGVTEVTSRNDLGARCPESLRFCADCLGSPVFTPIKADISGNITKIKAVYNTDPAKFRTLQNILEAEKEMYGAEWPKVGATLALMWLKRGLRFIQVFLQSICDGERDENHPNLIRVNATKAYEMALKKYHGWIVQKIFQAALYAAPYKSDFLKALSKGQNVTEEECLEKVRLFLVNYTATIDVIYEMYTKMNAELNYKV
ncbi:PREDICTED: glycolipid transfer protein isoform X1 [Myotis brandtii]|uniref:glycolipid transfer protein isoform X1 n=1 Tax=Myotis brandtii TaxID=109478 RepID=UPI000704474D|nr:PREDICTED: glycolipid transfer protein isoform X1 [Myotis brandtii]